MIRSYLCRCTKENEHDIGKRLAGYALYSTFALQSPIAPDEHGKPYFAHAPHIHVSISHSGGMCLAAVSDAPIGADIEYMDKRDTARLLRIAGRFFTADEQRYVSADPKTRFYEIWCAKESYMKYTGEGFSRPMPSFSVLEGNLRFYCKIYGEYMTALCSAAADDTDAVLISPDIVCP